MCSLLKPSPLNFLQNLPCRIRSRPTGQSRSRMRSRPAQIQVANRRAVSCPVEQWTHGEKLIERQLAVKNVSASESVCIFQVLRSNDLVGQDQLRQVRRVLRQSLNDGIAKRYAFGFPVAALQLVRRRSEEHTSELQSQSNL